MFHDAAFQFLKSYLGRWMIQVSLCQEEDAVSCMAEMDMGLRRLLHMEKEGRSAFESFFASAAPYILYRVQDAYLCRYIFLLLPGEKRVMLAAGPYTPMEITRERLQEEMENRHIPPPLFPRLQDIFASVPVIQDESFLLNALLSFGETLWQKNHSFRIEDMAAPAESPLPALPPEQEDTSGSSDIRMIEKRYAYENELLAMIRDGHVHQLSLLQKFPALAYEQRVADPVRNIKNYAIISSTLFRKAAEEGGVHPMQLNLYSSECAIRIERISSFEEGGRLMQEMAVGYAKLVRSQSSAGFSPPVRRCMAHVMANLSKELTLHSLAEQLNISPGYLSSLFKKETGQTLTAFITEKRMALGASLLKKTNMQVQTVAQYCGIADVNYFSRLFKRVKGISPQAWRAEKKGK